jgi:hypothetical protein
MSESTQPNDNNKPIEKSNLVAFRLPANAIPVYEDIAKQVYQVSYIKRPDITALAKYALNWFVRLMSSSNCFSLDTGRAGWGKKADWLYDGSWI